jgi:hypothetical protein
MTVAELTATTAAVEEQLRGETSVLPRRKGVAPWRGDGKCIDLAAVSSSAGHLALCRPLVPTITSLNRMVTAERMFCGRPFAWPMVLFCQTWEVPT